MMNLTFGLFTQERDSGNHGPLPVVARIRLLLNIISIRIKKSLSYITVAQKSRIR